MGWFDGKAEQRAAAQQAIRIADGLILPFSAWSLTEKEVRRVHRRVLIGALFVYAAIMTPITWAARMEFEEDPIPVLAFVGGLGLFLGLIVLLIWLWARRAARYRDPGIVISVGDEKIVLQRGNEMQVLEWGEIDARIHFSAGKSGLHFNGVSLSSRFGRLPLEDDWYCNGRLAGAVIVRGVEQAHAARERAKIEGTGRRAKA